MRLPKRNLISKNKKVIFDVKKKYQQPKDGLKPKGFWYSCYNGWYNWLKIEGMTKWMYKYIHKINFQKDVLSTIRKKNKNKVLVISNLKDFDEFNKKYGKNDLINWNKVSKDYGGIEICPHLSKRKCCFWYSTFDVASGCIWNVKPILKSSKLIYEKRKGKYIHII
jgi:hypothetical protein